MDQLLESATSEFNTTEDWTSIIQVCERADESPEVARQVVNLLSKRLLHKNVNVVLFACTLSNSLLQNCGQGVKRELSSRVFTDALMKQLASKTAHGTAKFRILDLIQTWAKQFKNDKDLDFLVNLYPQLQQQNYQFPTPHVPESTVTKSELEKIKAKEEEELALAMSLSLSSTNANASTSNVKQSPVNRSTKSVKVLFKVKALYDFPGYEEGELPLKTGQIIDVYDHTTFHEWWKGSFEGRVGIFPSNYVEKVSGESFTAPIPLANVNPRETTLPSRESSDESFVENNASSLDTFERVLSTLQPNDSISENEELQHHYTNILSMRPRIVKLLIKYQSKQEELNGLNDRFTKALSSYQRLMDSYYTFSASNHPSMGGYYPPQDYSSQSLHQYPAAYPFSQSFVSQPQPQSQSQGQPQVQGQSQGYYPYYTPSSQPPPGSYPPHQ